MAINKRVLWKSFDSLEKAVRTLVNRMDDVFRIMDDVFRSIGTVELTRSQDYPLASRGDAGSMKENVTN